MSQDSSPLSRSNSEDIISDQDAKEIMDLPTASLHSNYSPNQSPNQANKSDTTHNSSNISDQKKEPSPDFSYSTMSLHSGKNSSVISDNSPKQQNTAIYDTSASKSVKNSQLSHKDEAPKLFNLQEKVSTGTGAANTGNLSGFAENAFHTPQNAHSTVSRSDSPISLISSKISNPPMIEAQETSVLSRNESISGYVKTIEHRPLKTVSDHSALISARSGSYQDNIGGHAKNAGASASALISQSSTLDTSASTSTYQNWSYTRDSNQNYGPNQAYNREPAYFLANEVRPEHVDIASNLKFTYMTTQDAKRAQLKQAPPVPPRPGKAVQGEVKFRDILPGELPFAEMTMGGFQRYKDDQKCWVSARLTGLLNDITASIIEITGRCE